MDPRMNNKGEYNWEERGGRRPNEAGVYFHPESGKFIETAVLKDHKGNPMTRDGKVIRPQEEGKIQADAFVQVGYRQATEEELKAYEAMKEDQEKANRIAASRTTTAMSSGK